jgi:hypothetical protein
MGPGDLNDFLSIFCQSFVNLLSIFCQCFTMEIFKNLVAFSEYMNADLGDKFFWQNLKNSHHSDSKDLSDLK